MKRIVPPLIFLVTCLLMLVILNLPYGGGIPIITPQPVTAAVIVEETSDRPNLPKEVLAVLAVAPKYKVKVVDKDVLGKDGATPNVLVPFFEAAKRESRDLPQLVTRRGSDKYVAKPCPTSEAALVEALK